MTPFPETPGPARTSGVPRTVTPDVLLLQLSTRLSALDQPIHDYLERQARQAALGTVLVGVRRTLFAFRAALAPPLGEPVIRRLREQLDPLVSDLLRLDAALGVHIWTQIEPLLHSALSSDSGCMTARLDSVLLQLWRLLQGCSAQAAAERLPLQTLLSARADAIAAAHALARSCQAARCQLPCAERSRR